MAKGKTADDMRSGDADAPEWAHRPDDSSIPQNVADDTLAQLDPDAPVQRGEATQTLVNWLAFKADQQEGSEAVVMERIIADMLNSETPDEVLAERLPIHGKDFTDKPFVLYSIEVREGDYEDGAPFYAVMNVTIGSPPENKVISCGGWRVLAQLMALEAIGDFPQTLVIRGKKTKKGFTTLRLDRPL